MPTSSAVRASRILCTDLDGTLIPLENHPRNVSDLPLLRDALQQASVELVFVTGRHLASVERAIQRFGLPAPRWLVCDVGTTILECQSDGRYQVVSAYHDRLAEMVDRITLQDVREALAGIDILQLQEPEKQGKFKLSFYTPPHDVGRAVEAVKATLHRTGAAYGIVDSLDPFHDRGLIDILPRGVTKAFAIDWWVTHHGLSLDAIVYAGDSGNDFAALTSGCRAIVVSNADRELARRVYDHHRRQGWTDRLFIADLPATSGVWQGCEWFQWTEPSAADPCCVSDAAREVQSLGAWPVDSRTSRFRVWAPRRRSIVVHIETAAGKMDRPLDREQEGYFSATVLGAPVGSTYQYRIDGGPPRPDPASRWQPHDVHGPSMIVDPHTYPWRDQEWSGVATDELIIYEVHIGTFTPPGTFAAAEARIPELVELGITAVELLPLAQTPGRWNWGYDGVHLFAPRHTYGTPDDLKSFVDACHAAGLAVILDVVYNHLGPEGNYLTEFGPYFSQKHHTPWGSAFNYDGPACRPVRDYVLANAAYWLTEFHIDGLRIDAAHFMYDDSSPHILQELRSAVDQLQQRTKRRLHVIGETNVYDERALARDADSGHGFDAIWCDDLMHSLLSVPSQMPRLTQREYDGVTDVVEFLRHGHVYEHCARQQTYVRVADRRDRQTVDPRALVVAIQTHDSVGNHPSGYRLHQWTSLEFQRVAAALMLLYPSIPLLFMGEESAGESRFRFFVDFHDRRLRRAIENNRQHEYPDHDWSQGVSPLDDQAFWKSKCGTRAEGEPGMFRWYQALIRLRKAWRAAGWLQSRHREVYYQAEQQLVVLQYRPTADDPVFLAARIGDVHQVGPPPHQVLLAGTIILNSAAAEFGGAVATISSSQPTSEQVVSLSVNQAVVGRGRLELPIPEDLRQEIWRGDE